MKFEVTKLIMARAETIAKGSKTLSVKAKDYSSPIDKSVIEIFEKVIPFKLARDIGNGKVEIKNIKSLKLDNVLGQLIEYVTDQ